MWNCFKGINETNSSMMVQCIYRDDCSSRHTQLCKNCKYNKGSEEKKSYYKPKKE